ncbi:MAG TPA: tetratricopeptide repeat protein, partial [Novosphingobium sp.]|nr:tetratricopeptide repeat protein [Novosphingobium sp.]
MIRRLGFAVLLALGLLTSHPALADKSDKKTGKNAAQSTQADLDAGVDAFNAKDYSEALRLFTQTCEAGDTLGCANLGIMYSRGYGVPVDKARAATLYRRACDDGDGISCSNLGNFYERG